MTVSSTTSRKAYTGDGLTTSFATSPVVFFNTSDLVVYVVTTATGAATTLTENTHYTVSGGSGSTGTVSLAGGSSPYGAPSASQTLVISRSVPLTQAADFINGDPNDATVMETALDKLTMLAQQNATAITRSVRQSDSSPSSITLSLPEPEAGKALGWNASATALSNLDLVVSVTTVSMTAFGTSLVGAANAAAGRTVLGSSATGDSLFTAASAAAARSAISAATSGAATGSGLTMATAKLLGRTTASSGAIEEIAVSGLTLAGGTLSVTSGLPRAYLAGCGMANNGTDAVNDIDIAAGKCRDSTDAFDITVGSKTKQLDANWAAGTAAGMRYSGAAIANTTYHIWAVAKADGTQDIYATPNASAATAAAALALLQAEVGGSSYAYARRIGSILREGGAIVAFTQYGDEFWRTTPVLDVDVTNPGISAVSRTLSVPLGVKVQAIVNAAAAGASNNLTAYLSPLDATDATPSKTAAPLGGLMTPGTGTNNWTANIHRIWTNTSAQIRSRFDASGASDVLRIATLGWLDRRGRDD